ncbi:CATRA system-associated protein [Candidatus Protofrankia californiensis]|uniref:CATRA system-associated protein n=1 Tax=Candidatus Protofrankia californiensis TaxID=1839754 RepID=UPI0010416E2D|nr:CATRA system-associated protein [Candidatus Protofrankia californiensis]
MGDTSDDDQIRADILAALDNLLTRKLTSGGWEQAMSIVSDIETALESGDLEAARAARRRLDRDRPIWANRAQDLPLESADEYVRERVGELKHRVRGPDNGQPADDE